MAASHRSVITFALAALLAGCGYSQSGSGAPKAAGEGGYQWRSLYRTDVRTVAVPIFTNRTFRRGVEFDLSKAIINQIEGQSPYKVVSREQADTVLEGEIADISVRTLSDDSRTGLPQEQLYRVIVNFVWKDLRSGRVLVQRRRYEQTAPYYPTLGEGQFVGSQQNVERLALAIVQEMQADW